MRAVRAAGMTMRRRYGGGCTRGMYLQRGTGFLSLGFLGARILVMGNGNCKLLRRSSFGQRQVCSPRAYANCSALGVVRLGMGIWLLSIGQNTGIQEYSQLPEPHTGIAR